MASGGARYCDNFYKDFEVKDNKFTDNFAHIAGVVHIMNNSTIEISSGS